ncbi:WbqC-like protein [Flavobacterium sp. 90]|uniref:WbqC family protein n=1 Tax=unclassified Flavobacterium TaxID=196869 RepID=UPI000EB06CCA|nr:MULTISPECIES: WbqC family protein [unclassified Flavobacterium]RKR10932.1 WbqC-like protein [Flavobacterium sp. 81]TCK54716.1 WbqC-like protein [Flavobacterium sp. 90]
MKNILITQSNYIPWKGYFDAISLADEFVIYDDMQFTRRDWRNRNIIRTSNGNKWLTIPVEVKGKYFQKINETKISDKNWNKDHWNIIKQNYSKARRFLDFKDFFEDLYLNSTSLYLSEINFRFIFAICEILKIQTNFRFSSEFELKNERSERLLDICLNLNGTDYYSGPAAKAYMNEQIFDKEGVKIHYIDYSNYPEYHQMHEPFEHSVSILDLIFNEGSNSKDFLKFNK